MELKKNPKADLENRRGLYLEIGLVVILVAALVAFNLKSYDSEEKVQFERQASEEQEEIVIQTQQEELPPPPPPEQPEVTTEFEVVEDDKEVKNELVVNAEVTEETKNIEITPVKIEEEEEEEEQQIFTVVENDPEFPGGMEARITGCKVLRDIGGGCGAEAVRVVKSMPKWTPGKQRGKAVRVQFNLPVNFNLR